MATCVLIDVLTPLAHAPAAVIAHPSTVSHVSVAGFKGRRARAELPWYPRLDAFGAASVWKSQEVTWLYILNSGVPIADHASEAMLLLSRSGIACTL